MLLEIVAGRHRVCALTIDKDFELSCAAWDFLREQHRTSPGVVRGLKAFFVRYAESGRTKLPLEVFHHANEKEEIFQFIKGQLRLFCFIDGNCLILTHGALKKTQKASLAEINEAVSCRNRYNTWKSTSNDN